MSAPRSYQRGILTVVYVVLASALISPLAGRPSAAPVPAAQDLGPQAQPLGQFQLVERSGRAISEADLADRVCIVSFIFTRCQLSCPRITSVMKSLQPRLAGSHVLLVSLSVDPDHDTPRVLADYADRFDADPDGWWFLTGDRRKIYELIQRRFKLSVMENPAPDPDGKSEAIAHSDRLALVDRGRVVGLFDSQDPRAIESLLAQARRRAQPDWVRSLPAVNASLNAICAMLLVAGWTLIRSRPKPLPSEPDDSPHRPLLSGSALDPRLRGHIACMVLAVVTSGLFLTSYLVYHSQAGSSAFRGQGTVRLVYFTVLISHTLLATFGVVPLVFITLGRALRKDFARHRSIAAVTFPIWLYVSVTGVVIYLMLYQLPDQWILSVATR
jgi:protein SCO1/2/putative membrane protein